MVRRVLLAAVVAGAAAGIALTALQSAAVSPLLLAAESYEAGVGDPAPAPHRHGERTHSHAFGSHAHEHDDGQALIFGSGEEAPAEASGAEDRSRAAPGGGDGPAGSARQSHTQEPVPEPPVHEHGHHHGAWASAGGIGRTLRTAASNVAAAIGFALLLVALFAWRGGATWRQGLLWGAAGFFVFFANPAIGLHPEVPGAAAAGLLDRQLWWLFAVGCSAAGVGLLLLAPRTAAKVGGAALLAVPHLVGAPRPEVPGGLAPDELAVSFVVAAAATNAAFWLVLGVVSAVAFGRLSRS